VHPDWSFAPIPKFDDRFALQKHPEPEGVFNLIKFTNLGIEATALDTGTEKLGSGWLSHRQYPIGKFYSFHEVLFSALNPLPMFLSFAENIQLLPMILGGNADEV
jgi:hypothetical protein